MLRQFVVVVGSGVQSTVASPRSDRPSLGLRTCEVEAWRPGSLLCALRRCGSRVLLCQRAVLDEVKPLKLRFLRMDEPVPDESIVRGPN